MAFETFEVVRDYLDDRGYLYAVNREEDRILCTLHSDANPVFRTEEFVFLAHETCIVCYLFLPLTIPADKVGTVTEFITRVNYGIPHGNFEMDVDNRYVRYKMCLDCEGEEPGVVQTPPRERVLDLIYYSSKVLQRYGKGFVDVLYCGVSPKTAVDRCENPGAAEEDDGDSEDRSATEADIARIKELLEYLRDHPMNLD